MTLPQLASQPALPVVALAAATGNAPSGKHSASGTAPSDPTKGAGPFAELVAKAIAGAASSNTSIPQLASRHVTKQVSSAKKAGVPQTEAKSAAPAQKNILAQLLAAQSSTARDTQVAGKPAVQPQAKGEAGDQPGKASITVKTAPQAAPVSPKSPQATKASPIGQTITVPRVPSAPGLRQITKSDGLPDQTNKPADVPGSGSAALQLPRSPAPGHLRHASRHEAPAVNEFPDTTPANGSVQAVNNPKEIREQETAPQPEIQSQAPKQSSGALAKAPGGAEQHPVSKQTASLLLPALAIASKPMSAPPAAEDPKAPRNPASDPHRNPAASKAATAQPFYKPQVSSAPLIPFVPEPAPVPAPAFPLAPASQPASSEGKQAIAQPAAPNGVASVPTASAAPAANPAPMPGEHLAFALSATAASATAAPVTNRAASQPAPQPAPATQAGLQPVTFSGTETPKIADREPTPSSLPATSVPQQTGALGAGAWQPASFSGPAHQTPPPAPVLPQAAAPDVHEPDKPVSQDPLRVLRVQFTGDNNQRVDVRMGDAGGALRVSVRSTDAGLTQTLQTNLPELTANLGSQHFHTEVWVPQSAAAGMGNNGPGNSGGGRPGGFSFGGGHPNGQGQPGSGQQQNRQQHYQPEWIDDFQTHPRRAQITRRS